MLTFLAALGVICRLAAELFRAEQFPPGQPRFHPRGGNRLLVLLFPSIYSFCLWENY
jgi:hypothetical protein